MKVSESDHDEWTFLLHLFLEFIPWHLPTHHLICPLFIYRWIDDGFVLDLKHHGCKQLLSWVAQPIPLVLILQQMMHPVIFVLLAVCVPLGWVVMLELRVTRELSSSCDQLLSHVTPILHCVYLLVVDRHYFRVPQALSLAKESRYCWICSRSVGDLSWGVGGEETNCLQSPQLPNLMWLTNR